MRRPIAALSIVAILVAACGTSTPSPSASTATARRRPPAVRVPSRRPALRRCRKAHLRVLVHQNPPFTEFMETFNTQFEANHPGVTVEMSIVAPNDLATTTQTRLAANDVDVVDMFAFDTGVQPYMKDATPPIWQTLADAGSLLDLTGQPFVSLLRPEAATARCRHVQRQGLRDQPGPGRASAACTSTRTCSPPTTSRSRPRGPSSSPPARRSRPPTSRA